MAGLVPAIHVFGATSKDTHARDTRGHDEILLDRGHPQNVTTPRIDSPRFIRSKALLMSLSGITWVIMGSI